MCTHSLFRLTFVALSFLLLSGFPAFEAGAQDFYDDPLMLNEEDEFGFEQFGNDGFQDSQSGLPEGFQDFGVQPMQDPLDPFSPQAETGDQYLDEGTFTDDAEATLRDDLVSRSEILAQERKDSASNLGYGAGSGLMIGTWFAFVRRESSTREQFRTIGTSIVLGSVVGIMLGTRSVWDPGAPRPENTPATGFFQTPAGWHFAQKSEAGLTAGLTGFKIAYRWKF